MPGTDLSTLVMACGYFKLTVSTLNCGRLSNKNRQTVFHFFKRHNADIITNYEKYWNGNITLFVGHPCLSSSPHKCGVSLLLSNIMRTNVADKYINCQLQNQNFTFVGIYTPTKVQQVIYPNSVIQSFTSTHKYNII